MMLSKISRCLVSASAKNETFSVVLLGSVQVLSKRNFSIEHIGKRYGKPFDYKNKDYGIIGQFTDSTLRKLGENSLIITVDGNFGSGKSEFAKKLAKEIDFVYAREPDLDAHLYTSPNGHNMREVINSYVGDNQRFRIDSLEEWHREPTFKKTVSLQHAFYNIRWMQTRTALLHLLSTGQGVVLERSAFSDSVIGQALYENNLLSDQAWKFFLRDLIPNTLPELWRPHVLIYLDKSPEECLKNIKQNGKPFEKDSKVYNLDLLRSVDRIYKKNFIPEIRNHLHVLNYSSNEAGTEQVIEDLELLDFEDQSKFGDWRIRRETTINAYRKTISNYEYCVKLLTSPASYIDVPEYLWFGEDLSKLNEKLSNDPRYSEVSKHSPISPLEKPIARREWL